MHNTIFNHKNTSPAKKLRGIKRLLTFLKNKSLNDVTNVQNSLSVSPQYSFSIVPSNPQPELSKACLSTVNIPPVLKERTKLTLVRCTKTTITPRSVYHPAIINACEAMFSKHPSKLIPEEVDKFNVYQNRKIQIGEPLESEVIYLPIGGIRTCVTCGELT